MKYPLHTCFLLAGISFFSIINATEAVKKDSKSEVSKEKNPSKKDTSIKFTSDKQNFGRAEPFKRYEKLKTTEKIPNPTPTSDGYSQGRHSKLNIFTKHPGVVVGPPNSQPRPAAPSHYLSKK